jgi:hypothetical protein
MADAVAVAESFLGAFGVLVGPRSTRRAPLANVFTRA